jgi:hypothetical protein
MTAQSPPPRKPSAHIVGRSSRPLAERERPPRGEQRTGMELALAAHVDEPDPRGQRDGERGQDQRDQLDERLREAIPAPERRGKDVDVRPERVPAKDQQHEGEDEKPEREETQRTRQSTELRGQRDDTRGAGRAHTRGLDPVIR